MAGIGYTITRAILSDGQQRIRLLVTGFGQQADSGATLQRQFGNLERAISGVSSSADITLTADKVTIADYNFILERLNTPMILKMPSGFSADVRVKSIRDLVNFGRSEQYAFNVPIRLFIIRRR